ncbi:ABC transporter permease subunit [Pseudonocardia sp. NPDC049635]|uniref:ABC transporter permease n=1 Tax=Pseudonocardia sp. NPDC049635 TaxID=3155506 RepID=UPI0034092D65
MAEATTTAAGHRTGPIPPTGRTAGRRARLTGAVAATGVLLVGWQIAAAGLPELVLPSPVETSAALARIAGDGSLSGQLLVTVGRTLAGTAVGVAVGVLLGGLAARSAFADGLLAPVQLVLTGFPPVVTVVILMIWLGPGGTAAVCAVVAVVVPQAMVATRDAVRRIDPQLLEMCAAFAVPSGRRLRHVVVPAAAPPIVTAVAVSLAGGLRLTLMAEVIAASTGIGAAVASARGNLDTAEVFAWALIAVVFAALVDRLVLRPVRRRFDP